MMPKLTNEYKYLQTRQTDTMIFIMNMLIATGLVTVIIIMLTTQHTLAEHIAINCIDECNCYMDMTTYRVTVKCRKLTATQVRQMRISEEWIKRSIENIVFSEISTESCRAIKYWVASNQLQRVARLPENCYTR